MLLKPHNVKMLCHIDQYKLVINGQFQQLAARNFQLFVIFNSALFLASILK